jgi:hypothetical protein
MTARAFLAAMVATVAITSSTAVAAYPPEIQPLMKPVNAVLAAMAKDTPQSLAGAYTTDAVIVDDQTPYRWSGSDAPGAWLSALTTWGKLHYASFKAFADPMEVMHASDTAYVVIFGTLRGKDARTGLHQDAVMTFSLRKVGAEWKITSQSWTDLPPKHAPL